MNYEKEIIELGVRNNGYILTKDVVEKNISKHYLENLVKENKLFIVNRGLYLLTDYFADEYYELQYNNDKSVFSLETALYLHNYSNRIPILYNMTVVNNYGGNLRKNKKVQLTYVKKEYFEMGLIEVLSPMGHYIRVYDIERTICDIIKYKDKIDIEIFSDALKQYIKSNNKNINNLIMYARKLKIEEEVRKYMEAML